MANVITTLLKMDASQFKAGIKGAQQSIQQTDGVINKAKAGWTSALAGFASSPVVIGAATTAVTAFAVQSVNAASDLNESINAVNVTFGESADKILEFGDNAARSVGLAKAEFNGLATPLGAILKNAGAPLDEVADKTIVLTQRAADMASVFNTDVSEALGAIQAGLRGEQDPLEKFGVSLSAAKVEARALADTGKDSAKQLTDLEKQTARVEIILDQTNQTAGDFANTSEGLANQTRVLKAEFTNLQAAAGQQLIPVLEDVAGSLLTIEDAAKRSGIAISKVPGVPEFLKAAANLNPLSQQILLYKKLADGVDFVTSKWEDATPVSDRFNDSILRAGGSATTAADGIDQATAATDGLTQTTTAAADEVVDLGDKAANAGPKFGDLAGAFADAEQDLADLNEEARNNALNELAAAAEAVGDAIDDALGGIGDRLDVQDLLDDITDQFGEVAEAAKDATDPEGLRNYNRSVRELQRQLLTLLGDIKGIPPDKKVAIAADIERGGIDELYRILGDLSKGIVVPVVMGTPQQGFSGVNGTFAPNAIPSVNLLGLNPQPSSVDNSTTTIIYPTGTSPTIVAVDQRTYDQRNQFNRVGIR